ncbi:MAG: flagellar hook-length control protein FliK [Rhodospirillales bacterium]|nr:MAG: flagellar hook-length control protein FliK [Rhodospirillales bacterium]
MTGTGPEGNAAFSALPMPPTPIVTAPAPGIATAVGSATPSVPTALSDGPGIGGTTTAQLDTTTVRAEAAMHRAQPFLQRAVSDQVTVHITKAVREGSDHIEIKLRPAALGRVDVRLELGADGRVLATVTADTRQTLEMLRADARGLERALQDAGLQADSGSLSFNLRGDGHAQDRGEPRPGSVAPSADPAAGAGEDTAGHDVATANQNAAARRGGVDLHV